AEFRSARGHQLSHEADGAQKETREKRRDGSCPVQAWTENSENETGRDGRTDVGLDALQVNVELAADEVDEGDPEQSEQDHETGGDAAEVDQLALGGLGADFLIKIQGHQRGGGIEDGTHGAHDGGEQGGHDQSDETGGQKIQDERWVGKVGLFYLVGKQGESDDAGQDEHEDRQDFKEAGEDGAGFGVTFIARGEHALDDNLVGTPVPDAEDGRTEEDSRPGEVGVRGGLDHVEIAIGHHGAQVREAADAEQTDDGEGDGTGDQDEGLDGVGVDDGRESAGDGVDTGGDDQDDGGLPQAPT